MREVQGEHFRRNRRRLGLVGSPALADSVDRPYRSVEGGLVDIALTLHRISETRMCGLDLFERLMAIEVYELNDRLRMIDRSNFQ